MKQTLTTLRLHASKIFPVIIVIIAIIVLVILVTRPKKSIAPEETVSPVVTEETSSPEDEPNTQPGFVVSAKPFIVPFSVKANATTDDAGDRHGTFSVIFTIDPTDKDIVVSPTCYSEEGSIKRDGVAFSLIKDGVHITGAGLTGSSCVVLNHGTATKTDKGYYLVKAGTQNTFELIVVDNPTVAGMYSLQITNIGYRRSPTSVSQFFELSPQTLQSLKTNTISL